MRTGQVRRSVRTGGRTLRFQRLRFRRHGDWRFQVQVSRASAAERAKHQRCCNTEYQHSGADSAKTSGFLLPLSFDLLEFSHEQDRCTNGCAIAGPAGNCVSLYATARCTKTFAMKGSQCLNLENTFSRCVFLRQPVAHSTFRIVTSGEHQQEGGFPQRCERFLRLSFLRAVWTGIGLGCDYRI